MLRYILSKYVYELAMVCHVFSQYICFSLSVLSCFGVIDCSQDKYNNGQKKPTYVYVFLLGYSKNKCQKCYSICLFLILGVNVFLIIIWFEETAKVRKWNIFFGNERQYMNMLILLFFVFLYLACPSGYFGIDCLFSCPYPFFGRLCTQKCNCGQSECDFIKGCQRHGNFVLLLKQPRYSQIMNHHHPNSLNEMNNYFDVS